MQGQSLGLDRVVHVHSLIDYASIITFRIIEGQFQTKHF